MTFSPGERRVQDVDIARLYHRSWATYLCNITVLYLVVKASCFMNLTAQPDPPMIILRQNNIKPFDELLVILVVTMYNFFEQISNDAACVLLVTMVT